MPRANAFVISIDIQNVVALQDWVEYLEVDLVVLPTVGDLNLFDTSCIVWTVLAVVEMVVDQLEAVIGAIDRLEELQVRNPVETALEEFVLALGIQCVLVHEESRVPFALVYADVLGDPVMTFRPFHSEGPLGVPRSQLRNASDDCELLAVLRLVVHFQGQ